MADPTRSHTASDSDRIEFLERKGDTGQFTKMPDGRWFDRDTVGSDYSATLREAIDAAIRAELLPDETDLGSKP